MNEHPWVASYPDGVDWNAEVKPGPLEIGFTDSYIMAATGDRVPCVLSPGAGSAGLAQLGRGPPVSGDSTTRNSSYRERSGR